MKPLTRHGQDLARGALRAGLLAAALAALAPWAQGQAKAPGANPLQGLDCMIQPSLVVQVGAPSAGVIDRIDVERGDVVKRGQVLAMLGAQVERAALAVARERAEQSGEVEAAVSVKALARSDLERAQSLMDDQFVSKAYVERAKAEAEVAGGRTVQAEEKRRLAAREVELASAQLAQRVVRSPIDGVVVDRYMAPGEYIEQKPLLRLAAIDPLRVDVLVPAAAFGRVNVGEQGMVVPELIDRGRLTAVVKTVDRVIDAASNTFRVRLELPNPDHKLPAGLRCTVSFGDAPEGAAAAAAAATSSLKPVAQSLPAGR
ncbi:MAG: efflux RND transporter periplasmic adaptor subunit [Rubrivivax sp.]|nr:efflux RND transporter periplasmic adaptor subunit [Rubrivivax sp.]